MIVYKTIDQYDSRTGEKIGSQRVFDHSICDFTGEVIGEYENPNLYEIDFNSNDPCFGDGEGEGWYYDWDEDGFYHHELFGQGTYIFKTDEYGREVFGELLELAHKELKEVYSLDHLLRWSRGRMLEKVIKSGKYKIEDFLSE
jgi:hypothetical protein